MIEKELPKITPITSAVMINPPSLWLLLGVWFSIGGQSFGGGPSTSFLIRREFIDKHGWLSEDDYARFWVLCQLTPGINLISLTILIGKRLRGAPGIAVSLFGMLFPSTTITVLLAAGFQWVGKWSPAQAMLKGIIPATAGFMLLIAIQFTIPLLKRAKSEGRLSLGVSVAIILGCAALLGLFKVSSVFVLICGGAAGALIFSRIWASAEQKKISPQRHGDAED